MAPWEEEEASGAEKVPRGRRLATDGAPRCSGRRAARRGPARAAGIVAPPEPGPAGGPRLTALASGRRTGPRSRRCRGCPRYARGWEAGRRRSRRLGGCRSARRRADRGVRAGSCAAPRGGEDGRGPDPAARPRLGRGRWGGPHRPVPGLGVCPAARGWPLCPGGAALRELVAGEEDAGAKPGEELPGPGAGPRPKGRVLVDGPNCGSHRESVRHLFDNCWLWPGHPQETQGPPLTASTSPQCGVESSFVFAG